MDVATGDAVLSLRRAAVCRTALATLLKLTTIPLFISCLVSWDSASWPLLTRAGGII
jgi:hypothetical protein